MAVTARRDPLKTSPSERPQITWYTGATAPERKNIRVNDAQKQKAHVQSFTSNSLTLFSGAISTEVIIVAAVSRKYNTEVRSKSIRP